MAIKFAQFKAYVEKREREEASKFDPFAEVAFSLSEENFVSQLQGYGEAGNASHDGRMSFYLRRKPPMNGVLNIDVRGDKIKLVGNTKHSEFEGTGTAHNQEECLSVTTNFMAAIREAGLNLAEFVQGMPEDNELLRRYILNNKSKLHAIDSMRYQNGALVVRMTASGMQIVGSIHYGKNRQLLKKALHEVSTF